MHRIIYMKDKDKYTVVFTNTNKGFVSYMMYKKNKKIVYFKDVTEAEEAIENLTNPEFSLYYMGK